MVSAGFEVKVQYLSPQNRPAVDCGGAKAVLAIEGMDSGESDRRRLSTLLLEIHSVGSPIDQNYNHYIYLNCRVEIVLDLCLRLLQFVQNCTSSPAKIDSRKILRKHPLGWAGLSSYDQHAD